MEKHKSFWSQQEEKDLCHEIKLGKSYDQIAADHQRSPNAVKLRFAMILTQRLDSGEKKHRLTREYNIDNTELEILLKMYSQTKEGSTVYGDQQRGVVLKQIESNLSDIDSRLGRIEKFLSKICKDLKK
tara:strand:+ start:126 stop:512 length:387 start_codon:yes stop_codon:yes gene_type:complete